VIFALVIILLIALSGVSAYAATRGSGTTSTETLYAATILTTKVVSDNVIISNGATVTQGMTTYETVTATGSTPYTITSTITESATYSVTVTSDVTITSPFCFNSADGEVLAIDLSSAGTAGQLSFCTSFASGDPSGAINPSVSANVTFTATRGSWVTYVDDANPNDPCANQPGQTGCTFTGSWTYTWNVWGGPGQGDQAAFYCQSSPDCTAKVSWSS
jgi:hypothetical protein